LLRFFYRLEDGPHNGALMRWTKITVIAFSLSMSRFMQDILPINYLMVKITSVRLKSEQIQLIAVPEIVEFGLVHGKRLM